MLVATRATLESPQTEPVPILNTQKDTDAIIEAGKNHMEHELMMQELHGLNHTVGEEPILCITEDSWGVLLRIGIRPEAKKMAA